MKAHSGAPPIIRSGNWVDRASAIYRRSIFNPYWIDLRQIKRTVAALAPHAHGTLLDVGVGERPYGPLFQPHTTRYFGLEYPPACDNVSPGITGEHVAHLKGAVDVWGDGHALPFADASFDSGLFLEALEHLPDPARCVREMARVLRPDGTLLVTVPFIAPMHALPYDFYRYTPAGIRALLERHGLTVEKIEPRGNYASATGHLVAQWLVRTFAARTRHRDGTVGLSLWRAPFVLPLVAIVQAVFAIAERMSSDDGACLGYAVVARKPR